MILDDIKLTDKESLIFAPIELMNTFCHFLDEEHPDIDFQCIKAINIERKPDLKKKYRHDQEKWREAFVQAGYDANITQI